MTSALEGPSMGTSTLQLIGSLNHGAVRATAPTAPTVGFGFARPQGGSAVTDGGAGVAASHVRTARRADEVVARAPQDHLRPDRRWREPPRRLRHRRNQRVHPCSASVNVMRTRGSERSKRLKFFTKQASIARCNRSVARVRERVRRKGKLARSYTPCQTKFRARSRLLLLRLRHRRSAC